MRTSEAELEHEIFTGSDDPAPGGAPGGGDDSSPVPGVSDDKAEIDRMASQAIQSLVTGKMPPDISAPRQGAPAAPAAPAAPQETIEEKVARLERERDEAIRRADGTLRDLQQTRRAGQPQAPQAQPGQPGQPQQPTQSLADRLFAEPEAVLSEIQNNMALQLQGIQTLNAFERAYDRQPDQFTEAFAAFYEATGNPEAPDPQTYWRIMGSRDPGREVLAWYNQGKVLRDVGDDPVAYRDRTIAEHMASLGMNPDGSPLQQAPGGAAPAANQDGGTARGPDGRFAPRHEVRLPTAPGRLAGGSSPKDNASEDGSEEAIFSAGRGGKR